MDIFLPKGFEPSRSRTQMSRLAPKPLFCVGVSGVYFPVLRYWTTGFAVAAGEVPILSGVVKIFDGAEQLDQCLIMGHEAVEGEVIFTVKRAVTVDYAALTEGFGATKMRITNG